MKTHLNTSSSSKNFYNSTLLAYAGISALLLILLFDYVKPTTDEPVSFLTYFIYLIGGIGLYIFYKYNSQVQKEEKCANITHAEAKKILFVV